MSLLDALHGMYRFNVAILLQHKNARAFRNTGVVFNEYSALNAFNDLASTKVIARKLVIAVLRDAKLTGTYKAPNFVKCSAQWHRNRPRSSRPFRVMELSGRKMLLDHGQPEKRAPRKGL